MSISYKILLGFFIAIIVIVFILFLVDLLGRPKHVGIGLPIPPVLSWINKPKATWNEEKRTLKLQNGKKYIIPIDQSGQFIMLYDEFYIISLPDSPSILLATNW